MYKFIYIQILRKIMLRIFILIFRYIQNLILTNLVIIICIRTESDSFLQKGMKFKLEFSINILN